ncbi:hypothetical protein EVAR_70473_1 [Eumeta japonica]|uniref:Uncharacterized protein n=1 Tax=Eumeta variegata TaxID=151549 RepID=A0A4C2A7A1_EUMVA|nr:hypothetical protein EVAR_70473_1 [Eumeta japonica]
MRTGTRSRHVIASRKINFSHVDVTKFRRTVITIGPLNKAAAAPHRGRAALLYRPRDTNRETMTNSPNVSVIDVVSNLTSFGVTSHESGRRTSEAFERVTYGFFSYGVIVPRVSQDHLISDHQLWEGLCWMFFEFI